MTAAAAPTPTELTTGELSLLALTNPRDLSFEKQSRITLTTKESYLWATFLAGLAESDLLIQPPLLLDTIREEMNVQHLDQLLPGDSLTISPGTSVMKRIAKRLLSPPPADIDVWFQGMVQNADQAYVSLVQKGLIEDPLSVIAGGIAMVVLGLVPVSFTRQTLAGEQVLLRITSLFYKYEQSNKDGAESVDVRFHLLALVKAFYAAASTGFTATWEQIEKEATPRRKPRLGK